LDGLEAADERKAGTVKAPGFDYHRPEELDELLGLLATLENAKLLAGGQSLMPMLNMRYALPDHIIDINRVPDLAGISFSGHSLRIGAMTRQRAIERDGKILKRAPIFVEALQQVGHYQTRSRGTIGGSLCHLDPSAELLGLAALHDAVLEVRGPAGTRDIACSDWILGFMTPALETNELLTAIRFPLWPEPCGQAFMEYARRHGDFAMAGVGVKVALDAANRISRLAIAVTGVAIAPLRLTESEAALTDAMPGADVYAATGAELEKADIIGDAHVSADYRRKLAITLVKRAFALAVERARATHG
jgi:carbon-monoxide dehydrogenase medium subunit